MIRKLVIAASLIAATALFADDLIAEWDFSNGQINDKSGKYVMRFRGGTKVVGEAGKQALLPGISDISKPEGIESSKLYPELTPKGGFRLEVKFELQERTGKNNSLFFWDNKYIEDVKKNLGNPQYHSGFTFSLYQTKEDEFSPAVNLGFGAKSANFWGKRITIEPEEVHTIALQYDGKSKVQVIYDGKLLSEWTMEDAPGPLHTAYYHACIGDRYNASFGHFDGKIYSVKLFNVTETQK